MSEVRVIADQSTRQKFNLPESVDSTQLESLKQSINESHKGDARLNESGELIVRQLLVD